MWYRMAYPILTCTSFWVFVTLSASAWADQDPPEGNSLRGRFVYQGEPPAQPRLKINKDAGVRAGAPLLDESVAIADNGGIANVFVYLIDKNVPVRPLKKPPEPAEMQVIGLQFQPHALAVSRQQPLRLTNNDEVAACPLIHFLRNEPINTVIRPGQNMLFTFERAEVTPTAVTDNIRPWMKSYLLVSDNPYFAISDRDGVFEIKNLPSGQWTFRFWHEKAGFVRRATWSKGRAMVAIDKGVNDLGDIELTAAELRLEQPPE